MTQARKFETVTLTVSVPQDVALAVKGGARRAILPVFPAGRPPMNDDRSVLFTAEDRENVSTSFLKARTPLAVVYDHAKGARGGLAAGRLLRLIAGPDGRLDAEAALTPRAAREIADGEWFATSAKFRAWRDDQGNLRPTELRHLSLVPEPAIDGMGEIQLLSADAEEEPTDDVIPGDGDPSPEHANAPVPETGDTNPSPGEASQKKETEMPDPKATPAPGSAESGTGEPPKKETAEMSAAPTSGDVELAARIDKLVTERVGKVLDELSRRQKVNDLVEMAAKSGRITVGQRGAAEKLAAANPEAFEEFTRLAPRVTPGGIVLAGRTTDVSLTTESFSAEDFSDPSRRADLMAAAQELAAKDKVELDVALARLTGLAN